MIYRTCNVCGKEFKISASRIKYGRGKHCSKRCGYESFKIKKVICKCKICGKKFYLKPSDIKFGKGIYCSKKCFGKGMRNNNHPQYKNGKTMVEGYFMILNPNRFCHNQPCRILEHRVIMEKYLHRKLRPKEVVHHINGIKTDNRIENLMVFINNKAHLEYHNFQ